MGCRSSGMIIPFKGSLEEIVGLINNWTEKDFKKTIKLEFIKGSLVIIHNHNFFLSAYQYKDLWSERLKKSSLNDWVIFFECVDHYNAASYLIFKNNIEVRRITESENQAFYQSGEPQDFEKEWLNASIGYEHEYQEGNEWKEEIITDPRFSLEDIDEWKNYHKFYYIGSIDNFTNQLARQLLSDLSNKYLGFDLINDAYDIENKITLACGYGEISENQSISNTQKKSFFQKILFWK